jgi:uncharacterized membrane protein YqjE
MNDGGASVSLLESARRLGTTALDIAGTRLALFSVDLQEAVYRLSWLIIWGLIAVFFLGIGLLLISLLVVAYYWDSYRLVALGLGGFFLTASVCIAAVISHSARRRQALFAMTLSELAKDRDRLNATA